MRTRLSALALLAGAFLLLSCSDDSGNAPDQRVEGLPLVDIWSPPDLLPWPDATPPPDGAALDGQPPLPDGAALDGQPPLPDQGGPPCGIDADCDDGLSCTTNTCASGKCQNSVNPNFCAIEGQCIAIDTINPQDVCQKCAPAEDPWHWSNYVCTTLVAGVPKTYGSTDGTTAIARFYSPRGVAVGPSGEIYVADTNNHKVRMIAGGQVTTLAGSTAGFANGAAGLAKLNQPYDVAVGQAGEVYVADYNNHCIREIKAGQVTTFAGTCQAAGYADGAAASAKLAYPRGVAVGPSGEVYVADRNNQRIRMISGGQVSTLAGDGVAGFKDGAAASARFQYPGGVTVAGNGDVYVADSSNHRVRKISGGQVTTVAGNGTTTLLSYPTGVAVGPGGTVYIADYNHHMIRQVVGPKMTTLVGSTAGYENSPSLTPRLNYPWGIVIQGASTLYIGDMGNHVVRRISW